MHWKQIIEFMSNYGSFSFPWISSLSPQNNFLLQVMGPMKNKGILQKNCLLLLGCRSNRRHYSLQLLENQVHWGPLPRIQQYLFTLLSLQPLSRSNTRQRSNNASLPELYCSPPSPRLNNEINLKEQGWLHFADAAAHFLCEQDNLQLFAHFKPLTFLSHILLSSSSSTEEIE